MCPSGTISVLSRCAGWRAFGARRFRFTECALRRRTFFSLCTERLKCFHFFSFPGKKRNEAKKRNRRQGILILLSLERRHCKCSDISTFSRLRGRSRVQVLGRKSKCVICAVRSRVFARDDTIRKVRHRNVKRSDDALPHNRHPEFTLGSLSKSFFFPMIRQKSGRHPELV